MTKLLDYHEVSDKIETFCGRPQVAPTNKFGNRSINLGLSLCFKFAHRPCLSLRERYLPKGGGEGCADSGWRDAVSYKESVQWVCGWFVGGIGVVSPLRRFAPALPEGEPRAWWVSIDGGRVKGAVK